MEAKQSTKTGAPATTIVITNTNEKWAYRFPSPPPLLDVKEHYSCDEEKEIFIAFHWLLLTVRDEEGEKKTEKKMEEGEKKEDKEEK